MGYTYVQVYQGPKEAPDSSFIPRFLSLKTLFPPAPLQPHNTPLHKSPCFRVFTNSKCSLHCRRPGDSCAPWAEPWLSPSLFSYTYPCVGRPFGVSESLGCSLSCCPSVCWNVWDLTPLCLVTWASVSDSSGAVIHLSSLSPFIHSLLVWLRRKKIVLRFEAQLLLDRPKNTGNITLASADSSLTSAVPHVISGDPLEGCPHC